VSLTRREQAKAAELTAAGRPVTASAIAKGRRRYEAHGVVGMADRRSGKPVSAHGRVDPLVVEAMQKAIAEAVQGSTRTATYLFWRTGQILEEDHGRGSVVLPSQRSLYRLLEKLSAGNTPPDRPAPAGRWRTGPTGRSANEARRRRAS
jgi:hypothetical protein